MGKVRCGHCANEKDNRCVVKKVTIHPNKKRNCDKFILEESKQKEKQKLPTTYVSWQEREDLRKEMKIKRKEMKELHDKGVLNNGLMPSVTDEHPLTGDLSRFTTTAPKLGEE